MKRTAALLAAVLAAAPANAGQYLVPGPGGLRYAPPPRGYGQGFYNYAPRGYVPPGYLRPPTGYRPGIPLGAIIGGALAAMPRPVIPPPQAPVDAMDEIGETNPQGVTRAEVESAIADFCSRNPTASLCVKLNAR